MIKGHLISKANCQAEDSSKKRKNEFVFTSMRRVFVRFLEDSSARKKTFWDHLTFNLFTPKSKVHTHVCFQLVALPVGRFWIWPCWDLVFNRTLLTHKPNWKFIVLLNMMLVRHLGHFIFHKMTWHAAFVANSHFVLIHKGRIRMIVTFQAVNSNKRTCVLIGFKRHWQRDSFWNFAHSHTLLDDVLSYSCLIQTNHN